MPCDIISVHLYAPTNSRRQTFSNGEWKNERGIVENRNPINNGYTSYSLTGDKWLEKNLKILIAEFLKSDPYYHPMFMITNSRGYDIVRIEL